MTKESRGKTDPKSMIELLLEKSAEMRQKGESLYRDDQELVDEIITFAIAGTETTSNFVTAMFFYIFGRQSTLDRLR